MGAGGEKIHPLSYLETFCIRIHEERVVFFWRLRVVGVGKGAADMGHGAGEVPGSATALFETLRHPCGAVDAVVGCRRLEAMVPREEARRGKAIRRT